MLKVRLKNISTKAESHAMRTETMDGECPEIPREGRCFVIIGEALNPAFKELAVDCGVPSTRMIRTSVVKHVAYDQDRHAFVFETENSSYELTMLDDAQNPFQFS